MRALRPHQARGLAALKSSLLAGRRRPLLCAPTGAGKTRLAAEIVNGALCKGNRVTFVVPALSLIDQTVQSFWGDGIEDIGVIQANHPMTNPFRPVQVASVQTLQNRDFPETDVVVVDEAHRWFRVLGEWMTACADLPFIGLTATPGTKGLGKWYDDLIHVTTTRELIDQGYLSPFRVFAPSHPDLSGVRTVAGDYHEGDLGETMNKPPLVADVVDTWLAKGEGRPTLCFAVNRAHARHLQDRFTAKGVSCGYVDAYTDLDERKQIETCFHSGRYQVVVNVGCLTTGVDWDVRCIILARPTKSTMLFQQIIGRGLRTAKGKDDCLILDHSDTHNRLGFVTDIHYDTLHDGTRTATEREKKKREAQSETLPKECPACSRLKPSGVHQCPSCGFAPVKREDVETVDGELVQFAGRTVKKTMTTEQKRAWFAQLKFIAQERGYSEGWAAHQFKEKTGVWPNHYSDEEPRAPSPEVLSWVKSRQIAYAKGKAKGGRHAA